MKADDDTELQPPPPPVLRQRINISRPAYSEEHFQQIYQEKPKEEAPPIQEVIKKKLSRCSCTARDVRKMAEGFFPVMKWLPEYSVREQLLGDVIAGFTVGILRLPQGMAYGLLATLQPVYGLYTVFFPALLYSLMGTCMHLSIGSFAVVSIMTGTAVEKGVAFAKEEAAANNETLAGADEDYERARIATTVALLVGLIQIGLGMLHLGFISTYLALPLVRGFTTGAAAYVFNSQFKNLFGISIQRYDGPFAIVKSIYELFLNLHTTNLAELLLSSGCIIVLVIVKEIQDRYLKKVKYPIPIELIVIIIGTSISYGASLEQRFNVDIVGDIPAGLPYPIVPPMKYVSMVIADAFTISIVTFSVAVSMGFIFAKRNNYEIDPNQELYALGASNVFCSFFLCYPAASSLSRSILQESSGGTTQIAGTLSCMLILLVLLLMGPLFEPLPKSVLAAIVVVALRGMFRQFKDIKVHWKYSKIDCAIWLVTFTAVVLLGVDIGLAVGVLFAIFSVIVRTQRPQNSILGRIPNTDIYRDTQYYEMAQEIPEVKIFSVQSPIYYANADYIKDILYKQVGVDPLKVQVMRSRAKRKRSKEMKKKMKKYRKESKKDEETHHQVLVELDQIRESSPNITKSTLAERPASLLDVDHGHVANNIHHNGGNHNSSTATVGNSSTRTADVDNVTIDVIAIENGAQLNGDVVMISEQVLVDDLVGIHTVILDLSGVSFLDLVGINTIKAIVTDYQKIGVEVLLAQCRANIQSILFESGCMDVVGLDRMYLTLQDAVLHAGSSEQKDSSDEADADSNTQPLSPASPDAVFNKCANHVTSCL